MAPDGLSGVVPCAETEFGVLGRGEDDDGFHRQISLQEKYICIIS